MPWNGIGTYILPPAYSPEVNGTVIDAARYNGLTSDVAAGISNALAKDGQNSPVANIPMGGFKFTGLGAGTAVNDSLTWGQAITAASITFDGTNILSSFVDSKAFTLGIAFGGNAVGLTYNDRNGRYTKIGNRVDFSAYVTLANKGSSSGNATLTGLPFACNAFVSSVCTVLAQNFGSNFNPLFLVAAGTTTIFCDSNTTNGSLTPLTNTDFTNATNILVCGTYFTA